MKVVYTLYIKHHMRSCCPNANKLMPAPLDVIYNLLASAAHPWVQRRPGAAAETGEVRTGGGRARRAGGATPASARCSSNQATVRGQAAMLAAPSKAKLSMQEKPWPTPAYRLSAS